MSLEGQLDIFGGESTPPAMPSPAETPAVKTKLVTPTKCTSAPATPASSDAFTAPDGTEPLVFDGRGMYATPETIAKLDHAMAALKPGDVWTNTNGVPCKYIGRTKTNHLLHMDAKGPHIYVRYQPTGSPIKSYVPLKPDAMYQLDPSAHELGTPCYSSAIWYEHDGNTWNGRGRKPIWVRNYIEQGGDLEDILKTINVQAH